MLFSELKCKDVINIRDCKKLGHVCDLEFDEHDGCIRTMSAADASVRSWCREETSGWDSCAVSPILSFLTRTSGRSVRT